ncbi:MAG: hypothetical protein ACUBOA_05760 [Candidatus Loosdrechtia sp.]|uniref:hypothetical protein n=1 Tax=Candidatus Loosdrechtia sp. TaxID=3101272 RepID=UPI003A70DE65|nr:MAG: hypothetical protein QY305_14950 [Candidatus Jettenia sp. AMX2]
MSSCNSKAKGVTVVLVVLFGLLCVGFGISVTQKALIQKERVYDLERQLRAGRKEVLKIPELMENLEKVEVERKEIEEKLASYASEKDDLAEKIIDLQKEVDTFGAIKAAVGVQISGLQKTITEQQNRLTETAGEKARLREQLAALEEEGSKITEKFDLRIGDMKRIQEELKNQLNYYTEAKKIADQELAEKQKSLENLRKAEEEKGRLVEQLTEKQISLEKLRKVKEELEQELKKLKQQGAPKPPEEKPPEEKLQEEKPPEEKQEPSSRTPYFPFMDSSKSDTSSEELNKALALLRERIMAPTINLSEVSILLSRIESILTLTLSHFQLRDTFQSEELNKTFALLRERITSPTINLSEVSILLSRIESALKSLR